MKNIPKPDIVLQTCSLFGNTKSQSNYNNYVKNSSKPGPQITINLLNKSQTKTTSKKTTTTTNLNKPNSTFTEGSKLANAKSYTNIKAVPSIITTTSQNLRTKTLIRGKSQNFETLVSKTGQSSALVKNKSHTKFNCNYHKRPSSICSDISNGSSKNLITSLEKTIKSNKTNNVRVYARFRPLNNIEIGLLESGVGWITPEYISDTQLNIDINRPYAKVPTFALDRIFPSDSSQEEVYNAIGKEIVTDVMNGYNGTIFAYGQSGSGKTYTMYGNQSEKELGLIPRIGNYMFQYIENTGDNVKFQIKLSVFQIYKEVISDLLTGKKNFKIKESPTKGIFVDGLEEVYLTNIDDFIFYYNLAQSLRIVSETNLNQYSNRSHTIMLIEVTQTFIGENLIKKGILNLVDLAGSEKISKTGSTGEALEEAKKINLSLSALGNVIHALTSNYDHIPYRDSKLTRILQESLGGNYKTSLIITCSPHSYNLEETLSSLQFAKRAKNIKNNVNVNIKFSDDELLSIIENLKKKLEIAEEENKNLKKNKKNIDEYNNNNSNYREKNNANSTGVCHNCTVLKEKQTILENKLNDFSIKLQEKDETIKKLKNEIDLLNKKNNSTNNENNNLLQTNNEFYKDLLNKLKELDKINKEVGNNYERCFENDYLIKEKLKLKNIINEYNKVGDNKLKELFTNFNEIIFNEKNYPKLNDFNLLLDRYKNNIDKIYDNFKTSYNNNYIFKKGFSFLLFKSFLLEYIQFYYVSGVNCQLNNKINNDNKNLQIINSILLSVIDDLISKNQKQNIIIEKTKLSNYNTNNTIFKNGINLDEESNNLFTDENCHIKNITALDDNNISHSRKGLFVSYVNKKTKENVNTNINANKIQFNSSTNIHRITNQSIIDTSNNNIDTEEANKINNNKVPLVIETDDSMIRTRNNKKNKVNGQNNKSNVADEIINSKYNLNSTNSQFIKYNELRDTIIKIIKDNDKLKEEIQDIQNDFKKVIEFNKNYFDDLIIKSENNQSTDNLTKSSPILINDASVGIRKITVESTSNKNSSNNLLTAINNNNNNLKKGNLNNSNNSNNINSSNNKNNLLIKSEIANSNINISNNINNKNSCSSSLNSNFFNVSNNKNKGKISLPDQELINLELNLTPNNSINLKQKQSKNIQLLHECQSNFSFYSSSMNKIKKGMFRSNDYQDKFLKEYMEGYLKTGTATRKFDGIKVKYENNKVEYKFDGGLNAENKIDAIPVDSHHMCQVNGDTDSMRSISMMSETLNIP